MDLLIQTLIFGVLLGCVYALSSSGLALTYGVLRIVNLVHGSLLIAGGYVTYTLWATFGFDPIASIPLTAAVMGGVGAALYVAFVRPADGGGEGGTMMATFALMIAGEGVFALIWGNTPLTVAVPYARASLRIGELTIPIGQLYAAIAACVVLALVLALLRLTRFGRALRASASNPAGARFVGIDVRRISVLTYALGAAMAGAGGALISVIYPLTPDSWGAWLGRCLAIVVLGGLGSLAGSFLAALLLGLGETLVTAYVGLTWAVIVPYLVILLVMIARPQGILGRRGRTDVAAA
ncbi:branched-chain amino acid ABC transporter permease [Microbacterium sp. 2FI]|uniref:branched-chain amino acid ABC transporter permease n=1 Tax=Microbacterium sp. 2FI TaxID=2502193 RepID=UPI0010F5F587|nr:branched-chain amino acid ABC transporter permease [Microbacterium sp. 2FI]